MKPPLVLGLRYRHTEQKSESEFHFVTVQES